MASFNVASVLILAGLIISGYSQRYEGEPSGAWQSSRLQRNQGPSLATRTISSPSIQQRPEVIGLDHQTRSSSIDRRRNGGSRRKLAPPLTQENTQEKRRTVEDVNQGFRTRTAGQRQENTGRRPEPRAPYSSLEIPATADDNAFKRQRGTAPQRTNSFGATGSAERLIGSRAPQTFPGSSQLNISPSSRDSQLRSSQRNSVPTSWVSNEGRKPPQRLSNFPTAPSAPSSQESLERGASVRKPPQDRRNVEFTSNAASLRAPSSRGRTRSENYSTEFESLNSSRTRGRTQSSQLTTTSESPTYETEMKESQREQTIPPSTAIPLETVQQSGESTLTETLPTERTTIRRFPNKSSRQKAVQSTTEGSPKESQRSRSTTTPTPRHEPHRRPLFRPDHSRLKPSVPSTEEPTTLYKPTSREETNIPSRVSLASSSISTDSKIVPTIKSFTRSRERVTNEKIMTLPNVRKPYSRGEVKSKIPLDLNKNADDISDEDNYPKEFIEKIKSSSEIGDPKLPAKANRPKVGRSLKFGSAKPTTRSKLAVSTDSDVSESIHQDTIGDSFPAIVKQKESFTLPKTRYFGKSTTSTTAPTLTTAKPLPKVNTTGVDALRQRYREKLKQSQEERNQKLSGLRPKLLKDAVKSNENVGSGEGNTADERQVKLKPTPFPYKPTSRFSRTGKPKVDSIESGSSIKFRPRYTTKSLDQESRVGPATPTTSDNYRSRNRFSRLRKEELSVETSEPKSFAVRNSDAAYSFLRLRTKDLTPLGSETVEETVSNNEVLDTMPFTGTMSSSTESTTIIDKVEEATTTERPFVTVTLSSEGTTIAIESVETTSPTLLTTESPSVTTKFPKITTLMDPVTIQQEPTTVTPEIVLETTAPSQQATASTRHRFSSRYNGSNLSSPSSELQSLESIMAQDGDTPGSTLSVLDLFTSSPSNLSTSSNTSVTAAPSTMPPETTSTKNAASTTPVSTTSTVVLTTTTEVPGFLANRPILRNIVSLFVNTPTTTTTKKPKKSKPKKPKSKKKPKGTTPRTTTTTTTSSTTTSELPPNSSASALPLAISAEEVINNTQEVISNKTSFGSAFNKVPREELVALTPESVINSTESSSSTSTTTEELVNRVDVPTDTNINISSTTEMQNVTSQPVYFEYTTSTSTTPKTTTVGDYFVYGIYPNNTVVKKRAFKAFDYEKYMSPYVIFGIYPNNTIVRKFPNGTIINDEFMTSDNEINGSGPASTSTTTSTTENQSSSTSTTTEGSDVEFTTTSDETTTVVDDGEQTTEDDQTLIDDDETTEETTTVNAEGTTENPEDTTDDSPSADTYDSAKLESEPDDPDFTPENAVIDLSYQKADFDEFSTPSPLTSTSQPDDTTVDPSLNLVLPLSLEEVQTLWDGNFTDELRGKNTDNTVSSSINVNNRANVLRKSGERERSSLTKIAFRALSSSATTSLRPETTTDNYYITDGTGTSRKPRVKFVTLTPGVMVTTELQDDDAITMSSQHVQKVTKAPTQLPNDLFTNVFGKLEEKASSPIPDIIRDVGNEAEGDGLTAALARRIIALAMERAKSTTTESMGTTMTMSMTEPTTTTIRATSTKKSSTKKKQSTRTTKKAPEQLQQTSVVALPVGSDLQDVLQKLLQAQNLEAQLAAATAKPGSTTVKAPIEMEKTVENQIRLAEEVRKASRTMKKKKKKARTTTTQAPPFNLGFLFNFFNRPEPVQTSTRSPKKLKSVSGTTTNSPAVMQPQAQAILFASGPTDFPDDSNTTEETRGDRNTRGELLSAAIDVTRAVSKLMGTVMANAAQSFQSWGRNIWGR